MQSDLNLHCLQKVTRWHFTAIGLRSVIRVTVVKRLEHRIQVRSTGFDSCDRQDQPFKLPASFCGDFLEA